jgi:hypothetical protein
VVSDIGFYHTDKGTLLEDITGNCSDAVEQYAVDGILSVLTEGL